MSDERSVTAAMWLMLVLQTIGSVDMPGRGPRKMPAPRSYVAIVVAFAILELAADAGFGRAAKSMAWVMVLAGAVLGPFGQTATGFLSTIARQFAVTPQSAPQAATANAQPAPGIGPGAYTGGFH